MECNQNSMNNLIIFPTQLTPKVSFEIQKNSFLIEGESVPENAAAFYAPILKWLKEYESFLYYSKNEGSNVKKIALTLKYEYFNSTSANWILDLFFFVQHLKKEGYVAEINWLYIKDDTDMEASGKKFAGLCPSIDVNYQAV